MIQTISTIAKLVPLFIIVVFGFIKGNGNNSIFTPIVAENLSPMSIIGQVLIAI